MNALTARTLATFPPELQAYIRTHSHDDVEELVQQVALALLEARRDDTMRSIFNRARSAVRRFTQNPAHYGRGRGIDGIADVAADDKDTPPRGGKKRRELTREIAADRGVTSRRARQIVAAQVKRAKQGDLFADDGSDAGKGGE
jgi:hypothetical protein